MVSLSLLDIDKNKNHRSNVYAEDITEKGFTLVFKTWFDTIAYSMKATWIAVEK